MDDKIIISVLIYIFLVSVIGATLPAELFTSNPTSERFSQQGLVDEYNRSYENPATVTGQIGWFRKIITVLFVPFSIEGIPTIVGLFLGFLNYLVAFLGGIYIYDKIRGIS